MNNHMKELKKQYDDSNIIYKQITSGKFDNYNEAEKAVTTLYIMDLTVSRAGISHALSRLKRHYERMRNENYRNG